MMRRRPTRAAILALFLACVTSTAQAADSAAVRREAFELAYNLDHEPALARLRQALAASPDDPALHRALASVLWLTMLYQRGAVTVDHYLGSFSRTQVELSKPPAALDAQFKEHVAKAIELAERQVARAPRDAQAHYDLGAAVGLQASHVATVQGRMLAGFRAARRAYDEHERVLAVDPSRTDAALVVGTYRYVVSTLSMPMRLMAYVAGFGGGRDRGLEMVRQAAAGSGESRTDAMFALVLLYNRERRYDDALNVLGELRRLYPRNRLVLLEQGSTALRAGRAPAADGFLTEGLAMLAKDARPTMPGEAALWHYKRGAARLANGNVDAARVDLNVAIEGNAAEWVRGRAHTELAKIALRGGDTAGAKAAAGRAEALCQQGNDPACVEAARRLARSVRGG